ncbi:TrmH family RNA methyltransferase [Streptomyces uncialis]|uniref:TrmH family RNA methyltransferase n=1 Tax=Streptomyces uncialis TaxID=1048205 RepID=UPI0009A10A89|nr:TrmH family RNA methyltransferase [Streptomyces uncialis]WTE10333.1 RNA methyltransferase [Streptomyces uncialis]
MSEYRAARRPARRTGEKSEPRRSGTQRSEPRRSGTPLRISTRNAAFQQWHALLGNRAKRQRAGEFLIQGVRPLTLALDHDWPLSAVLHSAGGSGGRPLSRWARDTLDRVPAGVTRVDMDPELLHELGGKEDTVPELLAVARVPDDRLDRLTVGPDFLGVVFDRPITPGNIGTLIRSADAFGAHGVVVSGHAADIYDPKSLRASTGSLFALPVVRVPSPQTVADWAAGLRARGVPLRIVGTDERGAADLTGTDLTGPVLVVIGNETSGMSAAWRELCDETVRIPIGGAASSLNAAAAGTVLLYETQRQRGFPAVGAPV